ncbi:hypothetical protein BDQ12DRAFT_726579 [Crucibulum laeve]|uniref:T6SS Phospholipase effector Tle1-like catalytic domain-containing protein n=1 Tax=Crucibulum laeve TaxID=68775 RepID=A0A5C3M140_9AGAR|nr:hypothetical protein BDQ12DRAFT_726579 [Crucibulum laeve]
MVAPSQPDKPRTLVLCFDGTANEYDEDNTNVVKLFSLLKKDDFTEQLCFYQPGVGTWFNPGVVSPLFQWCAKALDYAFAWYLDEHVMDGYKFVMQNYRVGDKICIFGFSRGAYTARALGGLLYKVGLLPKDNEAQIPFAYKLYKREDEPGLELCAGFKQTYCQDVKVEFMGVWDTVASVGVVMSRTLPFTNSNSSIKTFRHALSLDEHRTKFRPNSYHRSAPNAAGAAKDPEHATPVMERAAPPLAVTGNGKAKETTNGKDSKTTTSISTTSSSSSPSSSDSDDKKKLNEKLKAKKEKKGKPKGRGVGFGFLRPTKKSFTPDLVESGVPDDVLEVWFTGCHSDVGGGAVTNDTASNLANITLRWMVREIMLSGCEIQFDDAALARVGIERIPCDPARASGAASSNHLSVPLNTSTTGGATTSGLPADSHPTENDKALDAVDVLQPIHDSLKSDFLWWILEILPLSYSWQDAQGVWHKDWSPNFGRGRTIQDPNPNFHISVKERIESNLKYAPRAKWAKGTEVYVQ